MIVAVFETVCILLFSLALLHGIRRYNAKRLLQAFTVIAVTVAIEENAVMLLTQDYAYYGYYLWIGEFPVGIMLGWLAVAYLGFLIASRSNVVIGATAAASVDLVFEPAAYFFGLWVWNNTVSSPIYFGAPIQNAVGWLLLTLIGTMILKKTLLFLGCKLRTVQMSKLPKCQIVPCTEDAGYDEKTRSGRWAYLCEEHHKTHGTGIGTKLEKRVKIAAKKTDEIPIVHIPLTLDSIVDVKCPHCGEIKTVEPDANYIVTCESCDNKYRVVSPI